MASMDRDTAFLKNVTTNPERQIYLANLNLKRAANSNQGAEILFARLLQAFRRLACATDPKQFEYGRMLIKAEMGLLRKTSPDTEELCRAKESFLNLFNEIIAGISSGKSLEAQRTVFKDALERHAGYIHHWEGGIHQLVARTQWWDHIGIDPPSLPAEESAFASGTGTLAALPQPAAPSPAEPIGAPLGLPSAVAKTFATPEPVSALSPIAAAPVQSPSSPPIAQTSITREPVQEDCDTDVQMEDASALSAPGSGQNTAEQAPDTSDHAVEAGDQNGALALDAQPVKHRRSAPHRHARDAHDTSTGSDSGVDVQHAADSGYQGSDSGLEKQSVKGKARAKSGSGAHVADGISEVHEPKKPPRPEPKPKRSRAIIPVIAEPPVAEEFDKTSKKSVSFADDNSDQDVDPSLPVRTQRKKKRKHSAHQDIIRRINEISTLRMACRRGLLEALSKSVGEEEARRIFDIIEGGLRSVKGPPSSGAIATKSVGGSSTAGHAEHALGAKTPARVGSAPKAAVHFPRDVTEPARDSPYTTSPVAGTSVRLICLAIAAASTVTSPSSDHENLSRGSVDDGLVAKDAKGTDADEPMEGIEDDDTEYRGGDGQDWHQDSDFDQLSDV